MKAEFLKLAGVKSEKEFYKKFPDEASFFKAHPQAKKMIKKAQGGMNVPPQMLSYMQGMQGVPNMQNVLQGQVQSQGVTPAQANTPLTTYGTFGPGNYNTFDIDNNQVPDIMQGPGGPMGPYTGNVSDVVGDAGKQKFGDIASQYAPMVGKLAEGFGQMRAQRRQRKSAEQMAAVSDVMAQAAETRPEEYERMYLRPEDRSMTGEELFPIYGAGSRGGTNVLAKKGASIPKAMTGFESFMTSGGGDILQQGAQSLTGNSAGGNMGGTIGEIGGTALGGPVGGAIGKVAGTLIGGVFDRNPSKIKKAQQATQRNVNRMMGSQMGNYLQSMNRANMEYGGEVSMMEQGGELQTFWGGEAEPISQNPYLPDGGETVMFRGNSHEEYDGQGNTGIGVGFGSSGEPNVEVERGEPAVKLKDGGTGEDNLTVYGNLVIPFGEGKGKKFKNYVADLSKEESKKNKIIDSSIEKVNELKVVDSFDKLKLKSLEKNIEGANVTLKEIAEKKIKAAELQQAINDTAEEYSLNADALAKGRVIQDKKAMKLKEAMFGTNISKAQDGTTLPEVSEEDYNYLTELYEKAKKTKKGEDVLTFQKEYHKRVPEYARAVIGKSPLTNYAKKMGYDISDLRGNEDGLFRERTEQYMSKLRDNFKKRERSADFESPTITTTPAQDQQKEDAIFDVTPIERNKWVDILGQALPFIRPTDAEALDANQLLGEMFALSTNQVAPVQAIGYRPELDVPYDISMQDRLNEITASERAAQRMAGYNPAMGAAIAGQAYGAKSNVLADQFRANQAMKDQVYSRNRAVLNDAQLKNLGIADTQFTRQQGALSATKATAQEALNSIASKYAQNTLANRILQTYENMYNYRFGPNFRAMNMNAPYQANIPTVYSPSGDPNMQKVVDEKGNIIRFEPINRKQSQEQVAKVIYPENQVLPMSPAIDPFTKEPIKPAKRGAKISKSIGNGSIVKMLK